MAKSGADWNATPKFPATHYVDSRIYTDQAIFEEEKEKLFKPPGSSPATNPRSRTPSTIASSPIRAACR